MNQQQLIEQMVKEVMASLGAAGKSGEVKSSCGTVTKVDYPLGEKRPELLKTPTGKNLKEITLDKVMDGSVNSGDVRISPETLELQAQVAESVGRDAFAKNLRRAAELIAVPDERILQIYNALRPYRSTKQELLEIADELRNKYSACINADFIKEAAEVYEQRNRLRQD